MSPNLPPKPASSGSLPPPPSRQRFLTRAEAVTLIGMLMVVFSLFLLWYRRAEEPNHSPGALFAAAISITRKGVTLPIRWPLTVCALACGALLMWTPNATTRKPLAILQAVFGLICLGIAISYLALLPGVLTALVGSGLLVFGAFDRLTDAAENGNEKR